MTQQRPIQPATTAPGTPHLSHPKYRADIDGLRAIAVLSVVAFHAFPGVVRGGFVGVDIFFVISGYLICTILFQNLERGSFSFTEFYVRRIRRIFPALVLVLVFVMVVGWFVLTADEYRQLGKQVAGGAGFVSNLLLWREAGYFDSSAEIKPLLHLWSLGIEEQFYLVWPCLLWFAWRRRFSPLTLTLVVAAASLCLNIAVVQGDMVAAFYSPVTRFWELLSGSLLAWWHLHRVPDRAAGPVTANLLSGSGLALLAAGFGMIHGELRFPGFWAAIPVAGALLVIAAGPAAWGNRVVLSSRICVWFGLISYPLYLWHWPLLSYAWIVQGGIPSADLRLALAGLSVLLAWATYRLIERPLRFGGAVRLKLAGLATAAMAMGLVGSAIWLADGFSYRRPPNLGWESLGAKLRDEGDICKLAPMARHPGVQACTFGTADADRTIFLYGDSHAQAIGPELDRAFQARHIRGVKVALDGCEVVPTIRDARDKDRSTASCERGFRSLLHYVREQHADVILASRWTFRLYPIPGLIDDMPSRNSEGGREEVAYREYAVVVDGGISYGAAAKQAALQDMVQGFLSTGQRIYLVYPVPEIAWNVARLNYQYYSTHHQVLDEISIPYADFRRRNRFVDRIFDGLAAAGNLVPIRPEVAFCNSFEPGRCVAQYGGVPFYLDDDHLSDAGARLVVGQIFGAAAGGALSGQVISGGGLAKTARFRQ